MRRWEVYRVIPQAWADLDLFVTNPYARCWTRRGARKMAAVADWTLRNGRCDADFAAFKVRKVKK